MSNNKNLLNIIIISIVVIINVICIIAVITTVSSTIKNLQNKIEEGSIDTSNLDTNENAGTTFNEDETQEIDWKIIIKMLIANSELRMSSIIIIMRISIISN